MKYTTVDAIVNEYIDFAENSGTLPVTRLKKYADFLTSKFPYLDKYVHKIKLLEVKNFQAEKPSDFESLVVLSFAGNKTTNVKVTEIVEWTQKLYNGSGCEFVITKKSEDECANCECYSPEMVVDVDRLWELGHPEYKYGHMAWYYRTGGLGKDNLLISPNHPEFKIIRPTRNAYFDSHNFITGCVNLHPDTENSTVEFKIEENTIRLNVESGWVIISYLAVPVDEEGWRLIPDIPELIEAITWYIEERLEFVQYKKTRDQMYLKSSMNAMQQKERFMGIAREILTTQSYHEFQRDLGAFYGKILPYETSDGHVVDLYRNILNRVSNV